VLYRETYHIDRTARMCRFETLDFGTIKGELLESACYLQILGALIIATCACSSCLVFAGIDVDI
jgi:hypothetical protein